MINFFKYKYLPFYIYNKKFVENLRIRTDIGLNDVFLKVKLEQNFENLEILSLKIEQDKLYQTFCSDYGVVCGRVISNDGFGIPNAKLSIFIPLNEEDESREDIVEIYPFKTPFDKNEITKVRYNLLPENKQKPIHEPVGTFPVINKIISNENYLEVHEKYYKFTTRTNNAGDYILFGVPTGLQTIHLDVDVSDIENLSLNPETFIGNGLPKEFFEEVSGVTKFKVSTNLDELPQIVSQNISVNVQSFWGDENNCEIGITRQDFDISNLLSINPVAVIFGTAISSKYPRSQYTTEKGDRSDNRGCNTSPPDCNGGCYDDNQEPFCKGEFGARSDLKVPISVSVDVYDENNDFFRTYSFDDGKILFSLPMNYERYITDELGNPILSVDERKGIPTKGKYRFNFYINKLVGLSSKTSLVTNQNNQGFVRTANYIYTNLLELNYDIFNKQIQFYTVGTTFGKTETIPNTVTTKQENNLNYYIENNLNIKNITDAVTYLIGSYQGYQNPNNFFPGNLESINNSQIDMGLTLIRQTQNGILYFHCFEVKKENEWDFKIALKKDLVLNIQSILGVDTSNYDYDFIYNSGSLDITINNVTEELKMGVGESSNPPDGSGGLFASSTSIPSLNTFNGLYFYFGYEKDQTVLRKLKEQFDGQI
jgi:hypothetical protein